MGLNSGHARQRWPLLAPTARPGSRPSPGPAPAPAPGTEALGHGGCFFLSGDSPGRKCLPHSPGQRQAAHRLNLNDLWLKWGSASPVSTQGTLSGLRLVDVATPSTRGLSSRRPPVCLPPARLLPAVSSGNAGGSEASPTTPHAFIGSVIKIPFMEQWFPRISPNHRPHFGISDTNRQMALNTATWTCDKTPQIEHDHISCSFHPTPTWPFPIILLHTGNPHHAVHCSTHTQQTNAQFCVVHSLQTPETPSLFSIFGGTAYPFWNPVGASFLTAKMSYKYANTITTDTICCPDQKKPALKDTVSSTGDSWNDALLP